MKRTSWRKQHKWFGLIFCFFMLMFCLSGIVLNHRQSVAKVDVSRKWLPKGYHYQKWNNGLLRGTLLYSDKDSVRNVLIYGTAGIWKTNPSASSFSDFNRGLPEGDYRQIRGMVRTDQGRLFAVGLFGLYQYLPHLGWQTVPLPTGRDEMLSDVTLQGDTLVVASRSYLYRSVFPYHHFYKIQLHTPKDYDGKVSLFRTVMLMHSGALFGIYGKLLMDAVAIALMVLCISGVLYWMLPKYIRKKKKLGYRAKKAAVLMKLSILWHDKVGRTTIILTLFIAFTGWCLRPPVLIALAQTKTSSLPGTVLRTNNVWNDKLQMIRYDSACRDWILATSDGIYALKTLDAMPVKIKSAPPVSVMGLNVWQKDRFGRWLCGSFEGLFVWDRQRNTVTDYFTHQPATKKAGPPFGQRAVSGFSSDFSGQPRVVEYSKGTDRLSQPKNMSDLPISLWNLCLEIHSGRIYIGAAATLFFIFFAGLAAMWCLWTGYKIRLKKRAKGARS
jgi:hypothetical protein